MNAQFWFWTLLVCFVALMVPRLFMYLARVSDPFPEGTHLLLRPLQWENVTATFDLNDTKDEMQRCTTSVARRLLRHRFAVSQEYLQRMEHNIWIVELSCHTQQRDARRFRLSIADDRRIRLSDAQGMLEMADLLESDASLPEYEGKDEARKTQRAYLRSKARETLTLVEITEKDQICNAQMIEALQAACQFRALVRRQLLKVDFLSVLLRLDKLGFLPAEPLVEFWHRDSDQLLSLYRRTRITATAYLAAYHQDPRFLTQVWGDTN